MSRLVNPMKLSQVKVGTLVAGLLFGSTFGVASVVLYRSFLPQNYVIVDLPLQDEDTALELGLKLPKGQYALSVYQPDFEPGAGIDISVEAQLDELIDGGAVSRFKVERLADYVEGYEGWAFLQLFTISSSRPHRLRLNIAIDNERITSSRNKLRLRIEMWDEMYKHLGLDATLFEKN